KRGDVHKVLSSYVEHGADADILVDARPHIGTNKVPHIIESIRQRIVEMGGEVHFDTKVTDIVEQFGQVQSVKTADGKTFHSEHMILATGHSARDIFERSEEHTSELQSRENLVCRLLLEKKKQRNIYNS